MRDGCGKTVAFLIACSMVPSAVARGQAALTSERSLRGSVPAGHTQTVPLAVAPNQFVHVVVDQGATDMVVSVTDPTGRFVAEYDERTVGSELVSFVAVPEGGVYEVGIRTLRANVGVANYELQVAKPRPAMARDLTVIDAERLTTEAKQLFAKGDRTSLLAARQKLNDAIPMWRDAAEPNGELSAHVGAGDVLNALTEYAPAEQAYREALSLSRDTHDRQVEAKVLNNLAMVALPLGRPVEATALLQSALGLWRELGATYGEAVALSNSGVLLWQSGEYEEARRHYERAGVLFRSLHDGRGEAYALNNVAMVLDDLGQSREALSRLASAVRLFRKAGDHLAEGRALIRRARIQLALGERTASLASTRRALLLIGRSTDRLAEADAQRHLGRLLAASGDSVASRRHYERALPLYKAIGSRRGEAEIHHDLGLARLAAGDWQSALGLLQPAAGVAGSLGLRGLEADILFAIARAQRKGLDLEGARTHLQSAIAIADGLRAGVFEREARLSYSGTKQRYDAEYVDLLMEIDTARPGEGFAAAAFEAMERARARGLVELLRESWHGTALAEPKLIVRERTLLKELNYWSWQLWQEAERPASGREVAIRARIDALLVQHAEADAQIRRADPSAAALLLPDSLPLSVIRQEVLDGETVLLAYALGERRSFVWAVTADGMTVAVLPPRATIERHAQHFYDLLSASRESAPADPPKALGAKAAALSRMLLRPVARAMRGRRVLVVADGILHYVPFAALPDPVSAGPFVAKHELVSLPSATLLARLRRERAGRAAAPKLLAVLADPVFDRSDPRVHSGAALTAVGGGAARRLTRLPFSREEAEGIAALASARLTLKALDFDANRDVATSLDLAQYRIVHFATHAIRDDRHPELSGIVLSLVGPTGRPRDGFLRLRDLYGMHLNADLVVLSACETGLGRQVRGEGLLSLARGLFYAGTSRIVSTLWKVDDEATAEMMRRFYAAMLGRPALLPAAALRLAQAAMSAQPRWRDPYYWSGFVLQGEW